MLTKQQSLIQKWRTFFRSLREIIHTLRRWWLLVGGKLSKTFKYCWRETSLHMHNTNDVDKQQRHLYLRKFNSRTVHSCNSTQYCVHWCGRCFRVTVSSWFTYTNLTTWNICKPMLKVLSVTRISDCINLWGNFCFSTESDPQSPKKNQFHD